jgi:hypothetical protein
MDARDIGAAVRHPAAGEGGGGGQVTFRHFATGGNHAYSSEGRGPSM